MSESVLVQRAPFECELEPKTYWWCSCGHSTNLPYCDGSHQGTDFKPVRVEVAEKKKVWLCGCGKTGGQPFCDGSHLKL